MLHIFNEVYPKKSLPEVSAIIKQHYVDIFVERELEHKIEKQLWKPVCVRACALANINETDQDRCLAHIMTLPQNKKTQINRLLLNEGK